MSVLRSAAIDVLAVVPNCPDRGDASHDVKLPNVRRCLGQMPNATCEPPLSPGVDRGEDFIGV